MPDQTLERELAALIDGEVRFGRHDRMLYATDASIYQVEPLGVVVPRSTAEALEVVAFCGRRGVAILPRGGGTSLAGQAVGPAVIVDFSVHCDSVLSIDPLTRTALVEPGLVLDELNRHAAGHGLMFGPDVATSSHATIGGMIGNNSAGAHSVLYGRTVEHLDAVSLALTDGTLLHLDKGAAERDARVADITRRVATIVDNLAAEIRRRYPRITRRVNGYNLDLVLDQIEASDPQRLEQVNLAHLACGSEGTLGVTIGARIRLVESPQRKGLCLLAFATLREALERVPSILETKPAAVELIDHEIIRLAAGNIECRRALELLPAGDGAPGAVLYVEYFDAVEDTLAVLTRLLPEVPSRALTDPGEMTRAWGLRKAGEPLLCGIPGDRKPITFIEDLAVDPNRLAEFVESFGRIVARHGTRAAYYAHASVGCLHIRPLISLHDPTDRIAMEAIAREATDLVKTFGGALSGEHGDGRARSALLERFYGRPICEGFRAIKAIFDPRNLCNPGNIVEPQPTTVALRVKPRESEVRVPAVKTVFRYAHGFADAVERCNGAGVCRKRSGGTMCPSYRALRDERHATRGRGNALRLAITGQLSDEDQDPAWGDPETIETLDLCLSCKACKAECPSNVDIAKLKAEYMQQHFAQQGRVPWRARLFGNVRSVNRLGSALWPLANTLSTFGPSAAVLKGLLGVHQRRSLPRFGRSLHRWLKRRGTVNPAGPVVCLLPDCFSVYGEPHIGQAAVRALESLGYRVVLPQAGCCGRAMISQGLVAEARDRCGATARSLLDALDGNQAAALVGLEPSCVSAIRDEWLDLDLGVDPAAIRRLAERTMLVEEFISNTWAAHPVKTTWAAPAGEILLHGHCHQKALWGIEGTSALLERLCGERLRVLDSGCCGMAGAFGYTTDHYDLSMAIGELSLFAAIRERPEATVVATGTSCRHQIADGTGRRAIHPVELLGSVPHHS